MFAIIYNKQTRQIEKTIAGVTSKEDVILAQNQDCILTKNPPKTITKYHKVKAKKIIFDKSQYEKDQQQKQQKFKKEKQKQQLEQQLQKKRMEALDKLIQKYLSDDWKIIEQLKKDITNVSK